MVERAKKENLDVSKLTEEAIEEALKVTIPKTACDYLQVILAEAGRDEAHYCEVHLLPFQIESLKLENVGPPQMLLFQSSKGENNSKTVSRPKFN